MSSKDHILDIIEKLSFADYLDLITEDKILDFSNSPQYEELCYIHKSFEEDIVKSRIDTCAKIVSQILKAYEENDDDYMSEYKYVGLILSIFLWEADIIDKFHDIEEDEKPVMYHLLTNIILNILRLYKAKRYKSIISYTKKFLEDMTKYIMNNTNTSNEHGSGFEIYYASPRIGVTLAFIKYIVDILIIQAYDKCLLEEKDVKKYNILSEEMHEIYDGILNSYTYITEYY